MASRTHAVTAHERLLLGRVSDYAYSSSGGPDLPDLAEEDIWAAVMASDAGQYQEWYDVPGATPGAANRACGGAGGGGRSQKWHRSREERYIGGLSLAFDNMGSGDQSRSPPHVVHQFHNIDNTANHPHNCHYLRNQQQQGAAASAPVNIPDWSRVVAAAAVTEEVEGDLDSDVGEGWVPPHEYIQAREHAASGGKMVATSVLEGVGRTLKGRDMSRVRDAVWTETGFFG